MASVEERIAALEARLAQLTATTPTSYYTHQYSGEEIDAAVGQAQGAVRFDTAQSLTPAQQGQGLKNLGTTWPCNPNLLDNWYFGNPVNQRGGDSKSGVNNGYWIDRWYLSGYDQTVEITQSGLQWASTTGIWLTQRLEDALVEALTGQTVTISAIVDGELRAKTQKLDRDTVITCLLSDGIQRIECSAENKWLRFVSYSAPTVPVTILAVKLELGSEQTLAHKEGDRWVLNEIPDYGEQLRRCQRYFAAYSFRNSPTLGAGWAFGRNGRVALWLPTAMRATPSIVSSPPLQLIYNNTTIPVADVSTQDFSGNFVCLNLAVESGLPSDFSQVAVRVATSGSIQFSADL